MNLAFEFSQRFQAYPAGVYHPFGRQLLAASSAGLAPRDQLYDAALPIQLYATARPG